MNSNAQPPFFFSKNRGNSEDLYSVLKIDRSASEREIRSSYLALASLLHPDKVNLENVEQLNKEVENESAESFDLRTLRRVADEHFQYIDKAFRVLSDPLKRAAYDEFGFRGISIAESLPIITGSNAITTFGTPTLIKEIVGKIIEEENQRIYESQLGAQGSVTVECAIFPTKHRNWKSSAFGGKPKIRQIVINQSIHFPVSNKIHLSFGGHAIAQWKASLGNAMTSIRYSPSLNQWYMAGAEFGSDPKTSMASWFKLSPTMTTSISLTADRIGPSLEWSLSNQHSQSKSTTLNWMVSARGGHGSINFTQSVSNGFVIGEISGTTGSFLNSKVSYTREFMRYAQGDVGLLLGLRGVSIYANVFRYISSLTSTKVGVQFGVQGVELNLQLNRGRMNFKIPIRLTGYIDPFRTLAAALISVLVDLMLVKITEPSLKAISAKACEKQKNKTKGNEKCLKSRARAARQVQLMLKASSKKRKAALGADNGLVILLARYGTSLHLDFGQKWFLTVEKDTEDQFLLSSCASKNINVTVQLQFLASKDSLTLPGSSKQFLLGFYDLSSGEEAAGLYVRYSFAGRTYDVTFYDNEAVELPNSRAKYIGPSYRVT